MPDGQTPSAPGYGEVDVKSLLQTIANNLQAKTVSYATTAPAPCTTTSSRVVAETVMCALFDAIYGPRPDPNPDR
jgi:hypothetical protein